MRLNILRIASFVLLFILLISFFVPFIKIFDERESKIELPYYFLILGRDEDLENSVRTDVIMLGALNEDKILLLSIPRDLLVNINGNERRINSIYELYGIETLMHEIENLTDVSIQDYIIFDYSIFKEVGDLFAPIDIYIEKDMKYVDYHQNLFIDFKTGYNQLNGEELLYYVRYRDENGDLGRIERQKNAVFSLLNEAKNGGISKIIEAATLVLNHTINTFEITDLIYLYSFGKDAQLDFLSFPYLITENSYVVVNEKELTNLKHTLKTFEMSSNVSTNQKVWMLVTKNFESRAYNFYTYVFSVWKKSNYQIKVIDEVFKGLPSTHSYVFFKDIEEEKKETIKSDLKESFGTDFLEITDKNKYFELIDFIASNLVNSLDYDVLVILNDRW